MDIVYGLSCFILGCAVTGTAFVLRNRRRERKRATLAKNCILFRCV